MISQYRSLPAEIKAQKSKMPVAYIGLGILEWHGEHNVAGLDGVKANGLAEKFAQRFGGVVMPPLYYGDNRQDICEIVFKPEIIKEATFDHTNLICEKIGYKLEDIQKNGRRSILNGSWKLWIDLMVHTFFQIESFGYKYIIPIPGHYPLFEPLDMAIERYKNEGGEGRIFVIKDTMFLDDGTSGDHAAKFETSIMLALEPDLVDLSRLDENTSIANIGVLGIDPRGNASAEFGNQILNKFYLILEKYFTIEGLIL